MQKISKSQKLAGVRYDLRGPVLVEAKRLEEEGYQVLKLNIGNTAPFGLNAPDELFHDIILNLRASQGYCDSKGLFSARKAVMQYYHQQSVPNVEIDDIYIGNGVSELIAMSMQGLLNNGDQMLVPAPDYPLWSAAVILAGGIPVYYHCDEGSDWYPDIDDMRSKVTERTRGVVVISPNNPTGAVYSRQILESIRDLSAEHQLIVYSDEIYDKILYDDTEHVTMASLCTDLACISFGGLSKNYRAPGFRAGWMLVSGRKSILRDYIEGLDLLANLRLCSNVPSQFAIQTALGGYQSINDLVIQGGRLRDQRDLAFDRITAIPGVTCVKPKGALYLFPRLDPGRFHIADDVKFVLDLLREKRILVVQGSGFNWPVPDHFRIVFLPTEEVLGEALNGIADFLFSYRQ